MSSTTQLPTIQQKKPAGMTGLVRTQQLSVFRISARDAHIKWTESEVKGINIGTLGKEYSLRCPDGYYIEVTSDFADFSKFDDSCPATSQQIEPTAGFVNILPVFVDNAKDAPTGLTISLEAVEFLIDTTLSTLEK